MSAWHPPILKKILEDTLELKEKANKSLFDVLKQVPLLPAENRKLLRKRTATLNKMLVDAYELEVKARTTTLILLKDYQVTGEDEFKHAFEFMEMNVSDFQRQSEVIHELVGTLVEERTLFRRITQARIATIAVIVALSVFSVAQFLDRFLPVP